MNGNKIELWHVPSPGSELAEKLEEMGLDANDLAARMGYTPKAVNDILQGNSRITPDVAIMLEMITEIPADYWLRRQMSYDEFLSRERVKASLSDQPLWRKSFPEELDVRDWVRRSKNEVTTNRVFRSSNSLRWRLRRRGTVTTRMLNLRWRSVFRLPRLRILMRLMTLLQSLQELMTELWQHLKNQGLYLMQLM